MCVSKQKLFKKKITLVFCDDSKLIGFGFLCYLTPIRCVARGGIRWQITLSTKKLLQFSRVFEKNATDPHLPFIVIFSSHAWPYLFFKKIGVNSQTPSPWIRPIYAYRIPSMAEKIRNSHTFFPNQNIKFNLKNPYRISDFS